MVHGYLFKAADHSVCHFQALSGADGRGIVIIVQCCLPGVASVITNLFVASIDGG